MDGASGTELWEKFQGDLTEDYFSRMTLAEANAEALRVIDLLLLQNGHCTAEYGLPAIAHATDKSVRFLNDFGESITSVFATKSLDRL
jgi:hypothetical protein